MMSVSSPISPRENRRANELAQRRMDALAAASAVFAAKGYHDAQMTEIAAAAEISRASLYSMFSGKEDLYQQVISSGAEAVRDAVQEKVGALDDPSQQLLCVIDSLFSCYEENQDLLRIYVLGTQGIPFKIRLAMGDSVVEISQAFSEWVIEIAKRAKRAGYLQRLDPAMVGLSLVGAVTRVAAHWIETTPERPLSQAAPPVHAIFRQLLGARGNS
jgi:AcrR family transcriptional regulator